jgi:hypothetical protein
VRLLRHDGQPAVLIDYLLIAHPERQGLYLVAQNLVHDAGQDLPRPLATRSTGYVYRAADSLIARVGEDTWPREGSIAIGEHLSAEDFYFQREGNWADPFQDQLEHNLLAPMPWILTSKHPLLTAACANTLAEFERTYRSLLQSPATRGKNLVFVSGLNIDISPRLGDEFPLTKFVPWAAFVQFADGRQEILEQNELIERLGAMSKDNPAQIDLERSIAAMSTKEEVQVRL